MKSYKYILALAAGLTLASCSKEAQQNLPAPQDGEYITIKAVIPETKVSPRDGMSWYWSAGDRITVVSEEDSQVFVIKDGFTPKVAEFVGKEVKGTTFSIYYPDAKAGSVDFSKQTQTGNGSIDHLKYVAALNNVDEYTTFSFSSDWAEAHGGSLNQTGVLKYEIQVPETVTAVAEIALAAPSPVFYTSNGDALAEKLYLTLAEVTPDQSHMVYGYMTTPWNEAQIEAGTEMVLSISTNLGSFEKDITFTSAATLKSGKVNTFKTDNTGWHEPSHYTSGKGTSTSPWVITTPEQMMYIKDDLVAGETRCFKLGADIDMTGLEWTPLNAADPFDKRIEFDGAGHTISNFSCIATSYPSFFGVLYGVCTNVKFVNATISATSKNCGILGGYGGTAEKPCVVDKVSVQGKVTTTANYAGGFFGTARGATITSSFADVELEVAGQVAGGLIGADTAEGVQINNCYTTGSINCPSSICGGICGDLVATGSSIEYCYSTMSIDTQFLFGGIVGRAVAGSKSNASNCNSKTPENHITACIAWNKYLKSTCADAKEHYSSGAIIGATAVQNYLTDCIRKADLDFTDCPKNTELGTYAPFDQENASPDTPLVKGEGTYAFGYHGKAAATGKTLSQVAADLGWAEAKWDLSGDEPKLKY